MIEIINNYAKGFDEKKIAHMYSIILRGLYEYKNMKLNNRTKKFNLCQMKEFDISFKENNFDIKIRDIILNFNVDELNKLSEEIYDYFKEKYPINYDYRLIDPIYFSLFFYDLLDKIIFVKQDTINIAKIKLLRKNANAVGMKESERYKALIDENYDMYSPFNSNLIINTPRERLDNALKSVKKNGYGYNNQYAIFYNDEPYLRDGQHRVAALKYLYGDIEINIVRFYLKDNYFYE